MEREDKMKYEKIKRFISPTSDSAFKTLFKEYDAFVDYNLSIFLGIKIEDIIFLDREQSKNKVNEHGMTLDILLLINKYLLLDIELNRNKFKNVMDKSLFYAFKVLCSRLREGEKYNKDFKFVQVNLNTESSSEELAEDIITIKSNITNKDVTDKFLIMTINIAKYYELYYNKVVKTKKAALYAMYGARDLKELKRLGKIALPKNVFECFWRKYMDMCNDDELISEYDREIGNRMVLRNVIKDTLEEGRNIGVKEGRSIGVKENSILIVKKMLKEKLPYDTISRISGLKIEEIKKLEHQE